MGTALSALRPGRHNERTDRGRSQPVADGGRRLKGKHRNRDRKSVSCANPVLVPVRVLVQASTSELLHCLSRFLCRRCPRLRRLSPAKPVLWLRSVDRALTLQGWQDRAFVTPANVVFVYLLCREAVRDAATERHLQAVLLTCFYLAYAYAGDQISYPLKPFLVEPGTEGFWERCLAIAQATSAEMLRINADPNFFTQILIELKSQGGPPDRWEEPRLAI